MPELGSLVNKVRAKNAGPFWITIDIFCGSPEVFARVRDTLDTRDVAALFGAETQTLKRFDIDDLSVVKFSFPRPSVQGTVRDRDMHGAAWAVLLEEFEIA